MEWRPIVAERRMPWVCAVSNGSDLSGNTDGRRTECFGVKVRPAAMCFWQYSAAGITLWLDIRCGGSGVILSGRKVKLCEIVFSEYRDITAFEALKKYYRTLCNDPIFSRNKVYGANNWYYAYGNSSDSEIFNNTDTVNTGDVSLEIKKSGENLTVSVSADIIATRRGTFCGKAFRI